MPLLDGLIKSIENPARSEQFDIGLLDFGLSDEERGAYQRRGILLVTPGWDYDPSLFRTPPKDFFKGMTTRPHLRKHFPGYDYYVWMDADTWVQDWSGIKLYLSSAETHGLAATPEVDRSYSPVYGNFSVASWRHNCFVRCFNAQVASQLALFPIVNGGVFAARADAPHWELWANVLGQIFADKREAFFFADQTAFNAVIRRRGIRTALLPATCNWMCNRALPTCSDDGIELREPHPPFQRISVVHLTSNTKNGVWPLPTASGVRSRSLRFGGHDPAQAGPDVVLPEV